MSATIGESRTALPIPVGLGSYYLTELPPGFLPFEEFEKHFRLGTTSTEQHNHATLSLSQTMHRSVPEGLQLLLDVDENVVKGLETFIPSIESLTPSLADKIGRGGRVFLVGSGSSGRVAIDIAAKCNLAFPEYQQRVRGVIAGGDSAFIRAKEGFEDSIAEGANALKPYAIGEDDTVILISASGSASFNVGVGDFAAELGADVLYFYNSNNIPERTQKLFDRLKNPIKPLCVDIGPQAISGSTRLQGATLAEAGLGALLVSALYQSRGEGDLAKQYPRELALKMREGMPFIRRSVDQIAKFAIQEKEVFSDPRSNFRQLGDLTDWGYVTLIARQDAVRESMIDTTETSPTFSTHPPRREAEKDKKRAEFRAYLVGKDSNQEAWQASLGREIVQEDEKDTGAFILSCHAEGVNSYQNRPTGKGNFLIGVAKLNEPEPVPEDILQALSEAKKQGGSTGFVLLCRGKLSEEQTEQLKSVSDLIAVIEQVPYDAVGFAETIILKQVLNLISNGSMVLMNKVHGNQMIDVRASNQKLIDRCIRLVQEIWGKYHPDLALPTDQELYHYVAHVSTIIELYEGKGVYTPSVVKIILAMLALKKTPEDFQEVIELLAKNQESIDLSMTAV